MSKEQETNKENKTPTLYTYYGKQYDFNDLRKETDLGFKDYLQTLRRGDKDSEELWNAYSNIMSGIGDGSITFEDGRFNDSLGRYSNGVYYDSEGKKQTSKKKSKDYYGLVANYIAGKLGKSKEYQAPEDKTKIRWDGNNSLGLAFNRRMFNTDNGNIADFIDLDPYNEETKTRLTSNRVNQAKEVTKYLYDNFDSLFTGYSDADSQQAKQYLQDAITSLDDGKVDSGDYLALSRAFGGINWRNMFTTQQPTVQRQEQQVQTQIETPLTPTQKFAQWVEERYPKYRGTLKGAVSLNSGKTYGDYTTKTLANAMSNLTDTDLYRIVRSSVGDRNYVFNNEQFIQNAFPGQDFGFLNPFGLQQTLQVMMKRGLLNPFDPNKSTLYYIPYTATKNNTGWVWDSANNTIQEMSIRDIPFWRQKMLTEYKNGQPATGDNDLAWATPYLQKGGVIKAQDGTSLWYSALQDYDPSKYKYAYDTSRLVNGDMSDDSFDAWVSNIHGTGVGRYKPSQGNTKEYTQGIENQNYYKTFGNSLFNPDGSFTDVGAAWAKAVDANLPKGSTASFYDDNGNLRTQWTVKNQDIYGRNPHTFNNLQDYVNYVRNDQILGARHNVFLNQGNRYFYMDENQQKHWVDPEQISNYVVSENPVQSGWNEDKTVYWNDYQLTGLKNPEQVVAEEPVAQAAAQETTDTTGSTGSTGEPKESYVTPRQENTPEQKSSRFGEFMLGITPDLIGAGRLFASLRTNNRVTDTIMKSLNPVLKNTYERYSPITGAFGEMQFRNNQAANLRRQASRPFTSDASLQLAGQLDADRQARDLEYQGFLADNKEIQRTREAALARQEDNMARRSEVANFNRASINQTNRERAELAATRLRRNWQSVDNFLQGIEGRLRTKIEEGAERRNNFRLQTSVSDIDSKYQDAVQRAQDDVEAWRANNPGVPISRMPKYSDYVKFIRDMQRWRQAQQYQAHANIYGYNYDNEWLDKTPEQIGQPYGYRNGGSLRPSTMYLINKVIRNESNT